jgi:hypothetical protein
MLCVTLDGGNMARNVENFCYNLAFVLSDEPDKTDLGASPSTPSKSQSIHIIRLVNV